MPEQKPSKRQCVRCHRRALPDDDFCQQCDRELSDRYGLPDPEPCERHGLYRCVECRARRASLWTRFRLERPLSDRERALQIVLEDDPPQEETLETWAHSIAIRSCACAVRYAALCHVAEWLPSTNQRSGQWGNSIPEVQTSGYVDPVELGWLERESPIHRSNPDFAGAYGKRREKIRSIYD